MADESVRGPALEFVSSQKELEELWTTWGIADPVPLIDFDRELALVITGDGSILQFAEIRLGADGNLDVDHTESLDLVPGFRYALGTVSRAGIRSVNGKEVPRHEIVATR